MTNPSVGPVMVAQGIPTIIRFEEKGRLDGWLARRYGSLANVGGVVYSSPVSCIIIDLSLALPANPTYQL